jgi:hypothetical protein
MTLEHITKFEAASSQLDHAIELFLGQRELISAITLAGAADEILSDLVRKSELTTAFERRSAAARLLYKHLWGEEVKNGAFSNQKTRNELKHACTGEPLDVDLRREAKRLLDRAVEDFKLLQPRSSVAVRAYERARQEQWNEEQARRMQ